jgi:Lar family restriction alleviation protein
MGEKLLPCPFCGGTEFFVIGDEFAAILGGYHVSCRTPSCLAQGRHSGDRDKAIGAWNRRTPNEAGGEDANGR